MNLALARVALAEQRWWATVDRAQQHQRFVEDYTRNWNATAAYKRGDYGLAVMPRN